jgi:hypothetical protein
MPTPSRMAPCLAGGIIAIVLLLAPGAAPARAAPPSFRSALPLLASCDDGFSIRKFMSGLNRRDRVVQLCVGVMCLALFILCKKFNDESPRAR